MPVFEIYCSGKKIAEKRFRSNFYVVKELNEERLRWEADEEQRYQKKGGEIHIWIQTISTAPVARRQILFVRPDWQLCINGTTMEQKFYSEVDVEGKLIELRHSDYSFCCSFSNSLECSK